MRNSILIPDAGKSVQPKKGYSLELMQAYNSPVAMIRFQIISTLKRIDRVDQDTGEVYKDNAVDIKLSIVNPENSEDMYPIVLHNVHVSKSVMNWLTYQTEIKDDDGNGTGEYATGFGKYKLTLNKMFPGYKFPEFVNKMQFKCDNANENYYLNPFRLNINAHLEGQPATLYLVNDPSKKMLVFEDPTTGEITKRWVDRTYKDTGKPMKIKRENYRRVEFRLPK